MTGSLAPGLALAARPYVEVEAILAGRLLAEIMIDVVASQHLDAFRRLAVRVIDALPALDRLRFSPTQFADRRRGEGNAEIGADAAFEDFAGYRTAVDRDGVFGDRSLDGLGARA